MPNLLQAVKFETKTINLLTKENAQLKDFNSMIDLYNKTIPFVGQTEQLKNKINEKIRKESDIIRRDKWTNSRKLPSAFQKIDSCNGQSADTLTVLNLLPKVKISEYKKLADAFNMVIIPLEYTQIDKLFDTQTNAKELKSGLRYFKELLRQDITTKYQMYILCPIDYYNVWEQIKTEVVKEIYYAPYFEFIFSTLELMIPSQKNLYLSMKANEENMKEMNASFNANIDTLNNKIRSVSTKVNKLEVEFIKEKQKNKEIQLKQEEETQELKKVMLKQKKEIEFLYMNIDPGLFAVPKETNILTDDEEVSLVGLCWGADIDAMVYDMKGITIEHKDLKKIDPINIEKSMDSSGFRLDFTKIVDYEEECMETIKYRTEKLCNLVNSGNWYHSDYYTTSTKLGKTHKLIFRYTDKSPHLIHTIDISTDNQSGNNSILYSLKAQDVFNYSDPRRNLESSDYKNTDKFLLTYSRMFEWISKRAGELIKV